MNTFDYPKMTPELQAYLDLSDKHPGYQYAEGSHTPTPESKAAVDAWKAEVEAAQAKLAPGEPGAYWEAKKVWYCRDETRSETIPVRVRTSPSGRYRLVVTNHTTGPGTWNYTKGQVFEGERLVTSVCRNYGSFPFLFVEDHPNGHDYLVCGSDYQGQTVVELDTGVRWDHQPKSAAEGFGFCWANYTVSPSKRTLAVSGCFWACPYEVWFVDFSEPMNFPLPVLKREVNAEDVFPWKEGEPDTCEVGRTFDVYVPLDKPESEMTEEDDADRERREAAGETNLWKTGKDTYTWTRPNDAEIVREYVQSLVDGWVKPGRLPIPEEFVANADRLLARLPLPEREPFWQALKGSSPSP